MFKTLLLILLIAFGTTNAHAEDKALARIQKNQEINCGVYVLGSIFSYAPDGNPQGFTADFFKEVSFKKSTSKESFGDIFKSSSLAN